MLKKKLAETKTEAEEARWFEDNQDRLLKLFEQAGKEGALRVGGKSVGITMSKNTETVQKPPAQKVMLRIPTGDLDRARRQAADKGIGYQTYIKMLLRAGLDQGEKVRRRALSAGRRSCREWVNSLGGDQLEVNSKNPAL